MVVIAPVVAPLQLTSEIRPIRQLRPVVMVESREYVVVMDRMAAIPKRLVGRPVANLLQFEYELRKALDLLFAGF